MHWRRTDPVQDVGGLFVRGAGAVERFASAMSRRPLLRSLRVQHGSDWAAVFAGPVGADGDIVLPRLEGSAPLHQAEAGWWLPVGYEIDAPRHVHAELWRAMADHCGLSPPAIVAPRAGEPGGRTREADVYLLREPIPFGESTLAQRGSTDARP